MCLHLGYENGGGKTYEVENREILPLDVSLIIHRNAKILWLYFMLSPPDKNIFFAALSFVYCHFPRPSWLLSYLSYPCTVVIFLHAIYLPRPLVTFFPRSFFFFFKYIGIDWDNNQTWCSKPLC